MDSISLNREHVLRVEAQNENIYYNTNEEQKRERITFPFTIRIDNITALNDLHALIYHKLGLSLQLDEESSNINFSMEYYDNKSQKFNNLSDISQLGKRTRINIIFHDYENAQNTCLALPSRQFSNNAAYTINGYHIFAGEVSNSGLGTGLTTWDGSIILAKYLEYSRVNEIKSKRVLELGAGTGFAGLAAAAIGASDVVLTDLPYTIPNLQNNIDQTKLIADRSMQETLQLNAIAHVLDWTQPVSQFIRSFDAEVLIAADVVWVEELIIPLVSTMQSLVPVGSPKTIFISHQTRSHVSDHILFTELEKRRFRKRKIPTNELHPEYQSDKISIFEIHAD